MLIEWEALLRRGPDEIVLITPRETWTRSQFERAARAVAAQLADRGTAAGDAVVIGLPNSVEFTVAALAARLCGAAVVNVPAQWRREMVAVADETRAPVVIAERGRLADAALAPLRSRALELDLRARKRLEDEPVRDSTAASWLAYTSGTTGQPKGAVHTPTTISTMIENFIGRYGLGATDRILVAAPLGHAVGYVYGLQLALAIPAPLVLLPRWDVGAAAAAIQRHRCSFVAGPTPFLTDLVERATERGSEELASLRFMLCGGAPVPLALLERARRALPNTLASAYYGSSECGGVTTCPPDAPEGKLLTTDGRPLPGMSVNLEGTQLLVRGTQVAAGYRGGDPHGRFRPDGWFASGDEARVDSEGWVRITGRLSDVIRRGGVDVAPSEVEEVLAAHRGLRDVAIVGVPDARLGQRVVAVVVSKGPPPSAGDLRELCSRAGLAKVKWPEAVVSAVTLPRSPSGKLLRREIQTELAAPDAGT
jgi:cyclohexanecarboxylate-CoA ligase